MKKYTNPQLKINIFHDVISATSPLEMINPLSQVTPIYAQRAVNQLAFTEYVIKQATSFEIQDIIKFK